MKLETGRNGNLTFIDLPYVPLNNTCMLSAPLILLLPPSAVLFSSQRAGPVAAVPRLCNQPLPVRLASGKVERRKKPGCFCPLSLPWQFLYQQLHLPHGSNNCHSGTPGSELQEPRLLFLCPSSRKGGAVSCSC